MTESAVWSETSKMNRYFLCKFYMMKWIQRENF